MKTVRDCYYVHRSNVGELMEAFPGLQGPMLDVILSAEGADWAVAKLDAGRMTLSLIESPDWDSAYEPTVGDSMVFDLERWGGGPPTKIVRGRASNPQVYHMKELFVAPGYRGFDVEKARRRTAAIARIPGIDPKRKGNADYWDAKMREAGMPCDRRRPRRRGEEPPGFSRKCGTASRPCAPLAGPRGRCPS